MSQRRWEICSRNCPESRPPCPDEQGRARYLAGFLREAAKKESNQSPSLREQAVHFGGAMFNWALSGFRFVPPAVFDMRSVYCRGDETKPKCEHWTGVRCLRCKCFGMKLHMPDEFCPIGLWDQWNPKIKSWAVGVTTAPGRYVLDEFLATLSTGGWDDVVIYAEPGSRLPVATTDMARFEVVQREKVYGAWRNRFHGIEDLLRRYTKAEAVLMFEDDSLIAANTALWLAAVGFPPNTGLLSLYRAGGRTRGEEPDKVWQPTDELCEPVTEDGFQRLIVDGEGLVDGQVWGSVAVAFPRKAAEQLIKDGDALHADVVGLKQSDIRLRRWCRWNDYDYWIAKPSRVQHRVDVGSVARMGSGPGGRDYRADDYVDQHLVVGT